MGGGRAWHDATTACSARTAPRAVETGLAAAEWYHTDVPRKAMKELMQRRDGPAIRDTAIWLGAMAVFAGLAVALWPTGTPGSRCRSGSPTASSTARPRIRAGTRRSTARPSGRRWMNDVVYQIACFMIVRNPHTWRWTHARHHTDTYIVGRDPEIAVMRPPGLRAAAARTSSASSTPGPAGRPMLVNALGPAATRRRRPTSPRARRPRWSRVARIWVAIYAATILAALADAARSCRSC